MQRQLLGILTHPRLERVRAVVPYPIFVAGLCFVVSAVFLGIRLIGVSSRGGTFIPSGMDDRVMLGIECLLPVIALVLLSLLAAGGWVSGYRPFRWTQELPTAPTAQSLADGLRAGAEAVGFDVVWTSPAGSFVAVRGMEMESNEAMHGGTRFPMRLSVWVRTSLTSVGGVSMKLGNRTVVVWDTGERQTCERVGLEIVRLATEPTTTPPPPPMARLA